MGQALYRVYRSTSLSEIVGQEHITAALTEALSSERISHAYLFTGPRGTGKTSIARILAHAINDLPYSTDPHFDIIEIDAASNRRIDEIRELRDKVHIAPTSAKYKVYIIDEVHMLTREAFNALLKTLEEPPEHVVFILATTDAHKLPETIISRTQRYTFRPVEQQKVIDHLAHIAKQEKIAIDDDALALLAEHGGGSFRDSISMLGQVQNHAGAVTADIVRQQLGVPPQEAITELVESLASNSVTRVAESLQSLLASGYRASAVAEHVSKQLRESLLQDVTTLPKATILELLRDLLTVASSHNPDRALELVLMRPLITTNAPMPAATAPEPAQTPNRHPVQQPQVVAQSPKPIAKTPDPTPAPPAEPVVPVAAGEPLNDAVWSAVLGELKKEYNTLYGIVRMAQTDVSEPGKVTLRFSFAFHQKRISDVHNRKIVSDILSHVTGQNIELICVYDKNATPNKPHAAVAGPAPAGDTALGDVSAIFGGGEVVNE